MVPVDEWLIAALKEPLEQGTLTTDFRSRWFGINAPPLYLGDMRLRADPLGFVTQIADPAQHR
jgi:hypothetical protein